MKDETVHIATYYTAIEANIIKGRLENEGIPCILTNENATTLMPYLSYMGCGTHLFVSVDDKERARQIISQPDNSISEEEIN